MKRSQAFPSQYLGKDDVASPVLATIRSVGIEGIKGEHGDEDKPVIYFTNGVKPMILNNTNWMAIEDAYGDESDHWSGKVVELYLDPNVSFGGKRVGGVRVRIPQTDSPQPKFNGSIPGLLSLDEAVAKAELAGLTRQDVVDYLKGQGINAWNRAKHTPMVLAFIEERRNKVTDQDIDAALGTEAEIPFDYAPATQR